MRERLLDALVFVGIAVILAVIVASTAAVGSFLRVRWGDVDPFSSSMRVSVGVACVIHFVVLFLVTSYKYELFSRYGWDDLSRFGSEFFEHSTLSILYFLAGIVVPPAVPVWLLLGPGLLSPFVLYGSLFVLILSLPAGDSAELPFEGFYVVVWWWHVPFYLVAGAVEYAVTGGVPWLAI